MGQFSIWSIVGAVSRFSAIEEGSHETKSSSSDNKAAIGRGATSSTRERHDVREKEGRKDVGVKGKEEADSSLGRSQGHCHSVAVERPSLPVGGGSEVNPM